MAWWASLCATKVDICCLDRHCCLAIDCRRAVTFTTIRTSITDLLECAYESTAAAERLISRTTRGQGALRRETSNLVTDRTLFLKMGANSPSFGGIHGSFSLAWEALSTTVLPQLEAILAGS